ncbi:MAG: hypothetical protein IJY20_07280, partial [Clostridia bacterium]|nr:hypothetical protein [Clostridia bacterium]
RHQKEHPIFRMLFLILNAQGWDSNAVKQRSGGALRNGDRSILQSTTSSPFRGALQNARTNPSLCAIKKSIRFFGCFF